MILTNEQLLEWRSSLDKPIRWGTQDPSPGTILDPQTIVSLIDRYFALQKQRDELAASEARYAALVDSKTARIRNAALDEAVQQVSKWATENPRIIIDNILTLKTPK